ncbi:hypothetical protein B0O99DRAFT_685302 [Bisporella sp. PMI_857]|nr:hypothetical protein B0O99DRAFT_685302 [Bisporella sp. PMI_857]
MATAVSTSHHTFEVENPLKERHNRLRRPWTEHESSKTRIILAEIIQELDSLTTARPSYLNRDFVRVNRFFKSFRDVLKIGDQIQRGRSRVYDEARRAMYKVDLPILTLLSRPVSLEMMLGLTKSSPGTGNVWFDGDEAWLRIVDLIKRLETEVRGDLHALEVQLFTAKRQGYVDLILCDRNPTPLPAHSTSHPNTRTPNIASFHGEIFHRCSNAQIKSVPKSDGQRLLPRGCFVIASILSIFVGLSLFFGLFFVIRKDYGYSMSDAFTLASYIVAVGALICSFLLACHFPHCQCWRKSEAQ